MFYIKLNGLERTVLLRTVVLFPGEGYCHIWAIRVRAAVKGMLFKQFTLR